MKHENKKLSNEKILQKRISNLEHALELDNVLLDKIEEAAKQGLVGNDIPSQIDEVHIRTEMIKKCNLYKPMG